MKRRSFIKAGALTASLPFWLQSCDFLWENPGFPIIIKSDHTAGHQLMNARNWSKTSAPTKDVIIVGGGISGLAAAASLKNRSFQLYELSENLGGTSSSGLFEGVKFAQGAHYELDYPDYYGEEVLQLLESLDIIRYQPWNKMWSFTDQQHVIPAARRQQCFENGKLRSDVIPEGPVREDFLRLMTRYTDRMPLPTRLISEDLRHLNDLTFYDFVNQHLPIDAALERQLDYHMMDDYGAGAKSVSALAGIHYFACRPYYREAVNLFSPPQGNSYFIEKLQSRIADEHISCNHLVSHIEKVGDHFELEILDLTNQKMIQQKASQVIYAAPKHALKYVYPEQHQLFHHEQAPWMVVSFICNQTPGSYGFWQNEFLGENPAFLGFIDSSVQAQSGLKGKRVFTGYYCLKPEDREYLTTIEANKSRIVTETQDYIETMLGQKIKPEAAFIHVMGHAMPIPKPGYLFQDANQHPDAKLTFAGVDNGRLPLLFEALDAGVMVGSILQ